METQEMRLEDPAEVGYKARKETESYLNLWLNDSTKGWTVRADLSNLRRSLLDSAGNMIQLTQRK